ncbi:hypothetical protein DFH08DRAFT_955084 [Mycena albidolilacea]|uniref:Uncharacterized protein n=1 Tax=Mycena albidolilacea TaxID=1033008 RepID=A0AAD7EWB8_9AGAR|nr:hypothetical protein DFH08DRAFT_955084 [Mycena albidolilacea]
MPTLDPTVLATTGMTETGRRNGRTIALYRRAQHRPHRTLSPSPTRGRDRHRADSVDRDDHYSRGKDHDASSSTRDRKSSKRKNRDGEDDDEGSTRDRKSHKRRSRDKDDSDEEDRKRRKRRKERERSKDKEERRSVLTGKKIKLKVKKEKGDEERDANRQDLLRFLNSM